ncbi:hypothetical protein F4819DRAFT_492293 [Hypoxylon fuscum]|nr:hypothetical protein F4819DRAFT_492293 [Hypoxylon fuscum]
MASHGSGEGSQATISDAQCQAACHEATQRMMHELAAELKSMHADIATQIAVQSAAMKIHVVNIEAQTRAILDQVKVRYTLAVRARHAAGTSNLQARYHSNINQATGNTLQAQYRGSLSHKLPDPPMLRRDGDYREWSTKMREKLAVDGVAMGNEQARFMYVYRRLTPEARNVSSHTINHAFSNQYFDCNGLLDALAYIFVPQASPEKVNSEPKSS